MLAPDETTFWDKFFWSFSSSFLNSLSGLSFFWAPALPFGVRNPNWRIICSWFGADASQMPGLIPGYVGCQPCLHRTPSLLLSWSCSALRWYPPLLLYWSASYLAAVRCSELQWTALQYQFIALQPSEGYHSLSFLCQVNSDSALKWFQLFGVQYGTHAPWAYPPHEGGLGCPHPRRCRKLAAQGLQSKHIKSTGNPKKVFVGFDGFTHVF